MSKRKSAPTVITPAIQAQIDKWQKFADEHNLTLCTRPNVPFFANEVIKNTYCPCCGMARPNCPCVEVFEDIKKQGHCCCLIFFAKETSNAPGGAT